MKSIPSCCSTLHSIFNHVFIVCCTNENENSRLEALTPEPGLPIIAIDQVVLIGLTLLVIVFVVVVVADVLYYLVGGVKELNND